MSTNPYQPPNAEVRDIEIANPSVRPPLVNIATALLGGTFVIGLINLAVEWQYLTSQGPVGVVLFSASFSMGLMAWLTFKIWQGRNWARITTLILFIVGVPFSLPQLPAIYARSEMSALTFVVQSAAQMAALAIVFLTPARLWYRAAAERAPSTPAAT